MAEGVLEACCLASVVLVPLCLDKNATAAYEPPKAALLQSIAIAALVAWILRALSPRDPAEAAASPGITAASLLRIPIIVAALCVVATTVLANALSLFPPESLFGHPRRGLGTLTLLAQFTLFALVVHVMRSPDRRRVLVSALIVPSIPLALYAVAQRLGIELLPVRGRDTELARSLSLFGQPVFAAAYFDMVLPFTALRAVECWRATGSRRPRLLFTSLHAGLALLQALALLSTESRGAVLGLLVAGGIALLIVAARRNARRVIFGCWALCALAALAIALSVPARLAAKLPAGEGARVARRAAQAFSVRNSSGGEFRKPVWMIAERALHLPAFEFADGRRDPLAAVRVLVGRGPETQHAFSPMAYHSGYPPKEQYMLIDRFHNQLWDELLTTGVLGLLAWLALQSIAVALALRTLGLLGSRRRVLGFWAAWVGGALAGAGGWIAVQGVAFAFLGLQLGAVFGMAAYVSAWTLVASPPSPGDDPDAPEHAPDTHRLALACLAAIVAHVLETSFSFRLVTTGMLFFIACGLLLVCSDARFRGAQLPAADEPPARRTALGDAALLTGVLIALGFAFLGANSQSERVSSVLWDGLTLLSQPAGARQPFGALVVAVATLGGSCVLLCAHAGPGRRLLQQLRITLALASALGLLCWCWLASLFAELASANASVPGSLAARDALLASFYVCCAATLLLLALARARPAPPRPARRAGTATWLPTRIALGLACVMIGVLGVDWLALRVQRADLALAAAKQFEARQDHDGAQQAYAAAIATYPEQGLYQAHLGLSLLTRASIDPGQAPRFLAAADQALRAALVANPIATEYVMHLAHALARRAAVVGPEQRMGLIAEVATLHLRALRMHPRSSTAWQFWSRSQLAVLNDVPGALASARKALALEPDSSAIQALVGMCHQTSARTQSAEQRRTSLLKAAAAFDRAGALGKSPQQWTTAGALYDELGMPEMSARALGAALQALPADAPERAVVMGRLQKVRTEIALQGKLATSRP